MADNTCFFQGEELPFGDAVFLQIQPPRAIEHGGGATCVDVIDNAVERLGMGGTGTQQRRKFLEKFLYLGRESGDGGGGLGALGVSKRTGTCLGEGAARGRVQDLLFCWDN